MMMMMMMMMMMIIIIIIWETMEEPIKHQPCGGIKTHIKALARRRVTVKI